jgi:GNAT superfamily N-acetyltransferase
MNDLVVRPISSKQDTLAFIKFLWKVYKDYPVWVPPLIMDRKKLMDRTKNPFYKHSDAEFYLAEQNGKIVGRIAAIVNYNHNKEHNENLGFFGFFECINDQEVANALLNKAKSWLKDHGVGAMRGPVNPSVNDEIGLLIEGFDLSPVVMMTYNPPYYIGLFEKYGLSKIKDLYAYDLNQDEVYSERFIRTAELVKKRNSITFRSLNMKDFDNEVKRIKKLYNGAWAYNWGAVPMTDEEFDALAVDLKPVVEPKLVIIAEKDGDPIGFALSLPDLNMVFKYNRNGLVLPGLYHYITKKKKINRVRIITLGVLPEYKNTGAASVLFYEPAVRAKELGYYYGEASWVLEDNVMMNRAAEAMNARVYKKYRLYEMTLE